MDKRTEILAAALKLFVEFGFHGTPTSMIAKEAGVANGTLFHYFKTKDELIVELYIDIKTRLGQCISLTAIEGESIKAKCKRNYVEALYWGLENKLEFKFVQQFLSSPFLLKIAPEVIQKQANASLELIQEGIDAKVIKPLPVDYLNTLLTSNVFALSQYLSESNFSEEEKKKIINDTFELIWQMLT